MALHAELLVDKVLTSLEAAHQVPKPVVQLRLPLGYSAADEGSGKHSFKLPPQLLFAAETKTLTAHEFLLVLTSKIFELSHQERTPLITALRPYWLDLLDGGYIQPETTDFSYEFELNERTMTLNGESLLEFEKTHERLFQLLQYILLQTTPTTFKSLSDYLLDLERQHGDVHTRRKFFTTAEILDYLHSLEQVLQGTPISLSIDIKHKQVAVAASGAQLAVPFGFGLAERRVRLDAHQEAVRYQPYFESCGLRYFIPENQALFLQLLIEFSELEQGRWVSQETIVAELSDKMDGGSLEQPRFNTHTLYSWTRRALHGLAGAVEYTTVPTPVGQIVQRLYRLNPHLQRAAQLSTDLPNLEPALSRRVL